MEQTKLYASDSFGVVERESLGLHVCYRSRSGEAHSAGIRCSAKQGQRVHVDDSFDLLSRGHIVFCGRF